jgi:hypothetical protein
LSRLVRFASISVVFVWLNLVLVIATSVVCDAPCYGISFDCLASQNIAHNLSVMYHVTAFLFGCLVSQNSAHNLFAKLMVFLLEHLTSQHSAYNLFVKSYWRQIWIFWLILPLCALLFNFDLTCYGFIALFVAFSVATLIRWLWY